MTHTVEVLAANVSSLREINSDPQMRSVLHCAVVVSFDKVPFHFSQVQSFTHLFALYVRST